MPSTRQPESASSTSAHVSSSTLYWTRKRIESRTPFGDPGIEARMPIVSGCLAVSHTLTVAHGVGVARAARPTEPSASEQRRESSAIRIGGRKNLAPICDGSHGRS